jgi:hypothetical protein
MSRCVQRSENAECAALEAECHSVYAAERRALLLQHVHEQIVRMVSQHDVLNLLRHGCLHTADVIVQEVGRARPTSRRCGPSPGLALAERGPSLCSTQVQLFHRFFPPSEQSSAAAARLATIFFAPLHEVMAAKMKVA